MRITIDEFPEYAEANAERKTYETSRGTCFSFELLESARPAPGFPYSIRLKSRSWSKSTERKRRCAPATVVRFLGEFNADNEKAASEYRNLTGARSSSARARYLLFLFRDLAEQKRRGGR